MFFTNPQTQQLVLQADINKAVKRQEQHVQQKKEKAEKAEEGYGEQVAGANNLPPVPIPVVIPREGEPNPDPLVFSNLNQNPINLNPEGVLPDVNQEAKKKFCAIC